ncbi:MauE/DoxX family redox-associated membrane protein [Pedobacter nyackensis]|uniref:MauE/DoxX family redox-associated membrane protein n=1 Tax=Pedobacter nyackensis TaxID=475255 RepID=UPI00292FCE21|nr:MauE/DoxX family redox-associated membrane protein [Pedobacter nyackensis]
MKCSFNFLLKLKTKKILVELCSSLLILLFLYAALMKLMTYQDFVSQLEHSPLLESFAGIVAWLVPVTEIGICALLIILRLRRLGFCLSFVLMLVFTAYIIYVINYAPYIPCACGGVLNSMGWDAHLVFNLVYSGIALTGLLLHKNIRLLERTG